MNKTKPLEISITMRIYKKRKRRNSIHEYGFYFLFVMIRNLILIDIRLLVVIRFFHLCMWILYEFLPLLLENLIQLEKDGVMMISPFVLSLVIVGSFIIFYNTN